MAVRYEQEESSLRRRRSRWVVFLFVPAGLVVLSVLGWVILGFVGQAALEDQLAAIRTAGEPLTFEDLEAHRTPVPDDANGALVLEDVFDVLNDLTGDAVEDLPMLGDVPTPTWNAPIDAVMVDDLELFLAEQADLIAALDLMADYPTGRYYFEVPADPLDVIGRETTTAVRAAAKVKALDALAKALEGRTDAAALDSLIILNIGATVEEGGTIVSSDEGTQDASSPHECRPFRACPRRCHVIPGCCPGLT